MNQRKNFRKFSAKMYRKILKAWITSTDSEIDYCLESTPNETDDTLRQTNQTIELNDSFPDSIPETPDFVKKRKSWERQGNPKVNKRLISKFINFEAEVVMDSEDSVFDDIEDTQKELEGSSQIIMDDILPVDTQPIGRLINGIDSRSAEDMQTVYLRSVKDHIIGNTNKYKLQYNYDPNIDVFSQQPNDSDLEDYQFDSFCVPNDSIEFNDSPQTDTNSFELSIESPVFKTNKRDRKKFKRIIFSP